MLDDAALEPTLEWQNDVPQEDSSRDRPRMLMVSPEAPWPATTGGLVRIGALLYQLAEYFQITFISPRLPGQTPPTDRRIRFICPQFRKSGWVRRATAALDPKRPFHAALYSRRQLRQIVRQELCESPIDVVYAHFIYSLEYVAGVRTRVVIDQQNVDRVYWRNRAENSVFPINAFARWNEHRTVEYENRRVAGVWGYVSVSDEDRAQTQVYAAAEVPHFWVAPNGVDTVRFTPACESPRLPSRITLGYLGSMDLEMNVEAVQRFCVTMLPEIRRTLPAVDVRFVVIGRAPTDAIRHLADKTQGMSLSGTVDDVVPWLQQVDILVCPLRMGAGSKLKVVEAMAVGLPVVGSALAFAGLPGSSGHHYLQADDDRSFVAAVQHLATVPAARASLGRRARELATANLDWRVIGERLARDITTGLQAG